MSYFPFFVEIGQKRCLVVGGGTVAFRKIEKLLPFGVEITVVSPSFCAEIEQTEGICRIRKEFQAEDVEDMCFVIGRNRLRGCQREDCCCLPCKAYPCQYCG